MHKMIRCGLILSFVAMPGMALAQWDAGSTADLGAGYGQTAMSQSTLSNTRKIGNAQKKKNGVALGRSATPMLSPERERALVQEYERRFRTEGRASADAWAREMGRRDGEAQRRKDEQR